MYYIDHKKSIFPILLTCRFPKYHTFNISVSNDLRLSFHVPLLCVFPFEMHYYNSFSLNGQVLEYQSQTNIHRFCGGGWKDETCFSCYFQNNLVLGNTILYTCLLIHHSHFMKKDSENNVCLVYYYSPSSGIQFPKATNILCLDDTF